MLIYPKIPRYLLEAATGIFSGSYHNDKLLYGEFLGESYFNDGRTIVQKTHLNSVVTKDSRFKEVQLRLGEMSLFDGGGIILIRDPYK